MNILVHLLGNYLSIDTLIYIYILALILIIMGIAWLVNLISNKYLIHILHNLLESSNNYFFKILLENKLFRNISKILVGFIFYFSNVLFIYDNYKISIIASNLVKHISIIYIIFTIAYFITSFINCLANNKDLNQSKQNILFEYLKIANIFIWIFTIIIGISILLQKSPWALLTGLGAISAVLVIVFKDTLLGLAASIQVMTHNTVQQGDWIEIPKYSVDGIVLTMSIHTVKVQNWDKTIITIPTYSLTSEGVKNWRGMQESGGRRIKRSINIDMDSIKFCDTKLLNTLNKLEYLKEYINNRTTEIDDHNKNKKIDTTIKGNGRQLTNIGLFRTYAYNYLRSNTHIHQVGFTILVRQLQPGAEGLPIEIYAFTNNTIWNNYENIQADIFDHLLSILDLFELKVFQSNTTVTLQGNHKE